MVGLTDFFRTVGPILLELCVGDLSVASGKGYTFVRLQRPGEFQSPASSWGSGEPSQPVHPGPDIHHGGPSTFETVGHGHGAKGGCSGKGVADRGRIVAGDMTQRRPQPPQIPGRGSGEPMTVDTKVIWEHLDNAIKVDGAVLRPTAVDWSALRVKAGSMTRRSIFLL